MSILHWVFNKGLKEEDKKEGLLKRLKNIETSQKSNSNDKSESSTPNSARSKLSTKSLSSDDDEMQISFEYFKDSKDEFFKGYVDIFYLDLNFFFFF